ncbi:hypothetical protein J6590_050768 [Homalodisca vitripennis]|nr:hypothetical protein J6590_050768 [Homalodisca vitripennis]
MKMMTLILKQLGLVMQNGRKNLPNRKNLPKMKNSTQPKVKTFKPKKKKSKNKKQKKLPKYPHVWKTSNFSPKIFKFDNALSGVVDIKTYPNPCTELNVF